MECPRKRAGSAAVPFVIALASTAAACSPATPPRSYGAATRANAGATASAGAHALTAIAGATLAPTGGSAAATAATAAPPVSNPPFAGAAAGAGGAAAVSNPVAGPSAAGTQAPARPTTPNVSPGMAGAAATKPMIAMPDQTLPPTSDYAAAGPFPAREFDNTGPDGNYTLFRPTNLAADGFKFVPATWGNGITTTPQYYPWLSTVASHGFVIVASNSDTVTPELMTKGLDWLIMQNDAPGDLNGKLDTSRAVCIGYSLGGGGAVTCGAHPKVIATVAMHPAAGVPSGLHGPLLLFSGTNDTVCVPDTFVQPVFAGSPVPTFFAMLDGADHLEPVVGGRETAPFIAWLRLWVFGDQNAKPFFYGPDCTLCKAPWTKPQSKMLP